MCDKWIGKLENIPKREPRHLLRSLIMFRNARKKYECLIKTESLGLERMSENNQTEKTDKIKNESDISRESDLADMSRISFQVQAKKDEKMEEKETDNYEMSQFPQLITTASVAESTKESAVWRINSDKQVTKNDSNDPLYKLIPDSLKLECPSVTKMRKTLEIPFTIFEVEDNDEEKSRLSNILGSKSEIKLETNLSSCTVVSEKKDTPGTSTDIPKVTADSQGDADQPKAKERKKTNRCAACNKRIGLTGIACRCGDVFCSLHRYTDTHVCPINYRELGAEEIRKKNPVIKKDKVNKI